MNQAKKELLKSYLTAIRDGAAVGVAVGVIVFPFAVAAQVAVNALTRNE